MAREFAEYRPWKTWAQFAKEIGKYVGQTETDRLKQYVFIPINLNTASDEDILSIPGAGQRMLRELKAIPPLEDEGTVRQGDQQVRRGERDRAVVALCRDSVGHQHGRLMATLSSTRRVARPPVRAFRAALSALTIRLGNTFKPLQK